MSRLRFTTLVLTGLLGLATSALAAERAPFDRSELDKLLGLASDGIATLTTLQREALA